MNEQQTRILVNWIKQELTKRGWSQADFAHETKLSPPVISRLLSGVTKAAAPETVESILQVLGPEGRSLLDSSVAIERPELYRTLITSDCNEILKRLISGVWDLATLNLPGATTNACGIFAELAKLSVPQLGWVLTHRAMCRGAGELLFYTPTQHKEAVGKATLAIVEAIDAELGDAQIVIDRDTLRFPQLFAPVFANRVTARLQARLEACGMPELQARQLAGGLKHNFVDAFPAEYRQNREQYNRLFDFVQTPFDEAARQARQFAEYAVRFEKRLHQPLFEESFSLLDGEPQSLYIPLRATVQESHSLQDPAACPEVETEAEDFTPSPGRPGQAATRQRVVIASDYLDTWQRDFWSQPYDPNQAALFMTAGAGAGKSTEARMFARRHLQLLLSGTEAKPGSTSLQVVYVPVHQLNYESGLKLALDEFCRQHDPPLPTGLLNATPGNTPLLLIFDGLDELSKGGEEGVQAARAFVDEVLRWLHQEGERRRATVLFCGRPLAINNAVNRDHHGHVLQLLGYALTENEREQLHDPQALLKTDQRDVWWQRYGVLKGESLAAMPEELKQHNQILDEITSQPLLNFLLALTRARGFQFREKFNRSQLYGYLLRQVLKRPYAETPYGSANLQLKLKPEEIEELLEEIALAAWHRGGREVPVSQVKSQLTERQQLRLRDLAKDLDSGLMRLFLAFYIEVKSKEQQTFEFTHKSFGEYLTARRMVSKVLTLHRQHNLRREDPDNGKSLDAVLLDWLKLFGPARMTHELFEFVVAEILEGTTGPADAPLFRGVRLSQFDPEEQRRDYGPIGLREFINLLINRVLNQSFPAEELVKEGLKFKGLNEWSIAAEEALLALHYAVNNAAYEAGLEAVLGTPAPAGESDKARDNLRLPLDVEWPENTTLGSWLCRLTGVMRGVPLVARRLRFLPLQEQSLFLADLSEADFTKAHLAEADFTKAQLAEADFTGAHLTGADLTGADLTDANLFRVDLTRADLTGVDLTRADLTGADLSGANLFRANLIEANLSGANLIGANLIEAKLFRSDLSEANLRHATVQGLALSKTRGRPAYLPDGTVPTISTRFQ